MIAPAGRKLGKYEIRQKLGRGGMADVYLAEDGERHHPVALKLIEHAADPEISEIIEAERRGIHLQAQLAGIDPRVVRIYDAGDLDGYFFIAMEYVDGQDLAELLRRGPLAPRAAVDIAIAVAETLEHAHTLAVAIDGKDFHGIVHGDIKPRNIRIDSREQVRVLDFGIAKALSLSRRLTRNEYGSVPYASPERLDFGQVDASSDLWSLGVMLYEMATGLQPYQADSTERLERMILSRIPPPPAPDPCPEPLRRILRKAMAPDAEMRYRDARSFAADLRAFREGKPVDIAEEDLGVTRRTFRAAAVDDATRRTTGPLPNGRAASSGSDTKPAKPRPNLFLNFMRLTGALIVVSFLYGAWAITSQYLLWKHGQQLERAIETEQITDPDQIWARWTELSKGNPSSWLLYGPRKEVRQKFLDAADRVIDTYRTDSQAVYEKDWERARTMAQHALSASPDNAARYRLRLADGQIARINGTTHNSAAELNAAVEDFTEAQRMMPKSPDPELGLARVYVYGFKDIDHAWQALQQASKLGYSLGNREKQQLADGYLARADSTWWASRKVRGLPEEKEQIQRVADDYKRALQLYQQIAPYGNANSSIVRVGISLVAVEFRLHQLDPSLERSQ